MISRFTEGGSSPKRHAVQTRTVYSYYILFEVQLMKESDKNLMFSHNGAHAKDTIQISKQYGHFKIVLKEVNKGWSQEELNW